MTYDKDLEDFLNRGYRYALSLTSCEDNAFDLVQSAYLNLREKNKPLVIAYFIRTIRNLHIDKQRKHIVQLKWMNSSNSNNNHYSPKIGVEPFLEKLLAKLPVQNREILFLSVVEEYTAQEIADLLEMPRGTVLSILSRTKKKLKSALEENPNSVK